MKKTNKDDYLTLANKRYNDNKEAKKDKIKLEREKFNHQKRKDVKNAVLSIIVGLPIMIIIITFTVIWLKILTH